MPKHPMTVLDLLQFISDKPLDMPVVISTDGPCQGEDGWNVVASVTAQVGLTDGTSAQHLEIFPSMDRIRVWNPNGHDDWLEKKPVETLILVAETDMDD